MANDQKKFVPINYTSREFSTIRDDLLEMAERLYPDSFQDFSEASFASLMVDAVAYVGDQLSFYTDYNVNESFLDTAYQYNNILRHGRVLGYKFTGRPSTFGEVSLFIMVPTSTTGIGPDSDYIPILKRGTQFTATNGLNYSLISNIDFSDSKYPIVVARVSPTTGAPTHYAIKAYATVVSGIFTTEKIDVGSYERFKRVRLGTANKIWYIKKLLIKIINLTMFHQLLSLFLLLENLLSKETETMHFFNLVAERQMKAQLLQIHSLLLWTYLVKIIQLQQLLIPHV